MSQRRKITDALVTLIEDNLNGIEYTTNLYHNVENKLRFWDEINDYPYCCVVAGLETREYKPSNFKWGYLNISIKVYMETQNSIQDLDQFFEDIEALLDANNDLVYDSDTGDTIELISILSIDSDAGLLYPMAVGEVTIQVQYDL